MKLRPIAHWIALSVLMLLEAWLVSYQLRFGRLIGLPDSAWKTLAEQVPTLVQILVVALGAAVVFSWSGISHQWGGGLRVGSFASLTWAYFLAHLGVFSGYLALTALLLNGEVPHSAWIVVWGSLGAASIAFLGLTALPADKWRQLTRRDWLICLAGLSIGVLAVVGSRWTASLWKPLSDATFWLVRVMLGTFVPEVICTPEEYLIGTPAFEVTIGEPCSGYEGIGLIWVFLAGYVWLFRSSLRFPQALLLFPLGTALIWLSNAVRITALILIGAYWSPDVAERGFHSQAGWLAFNAVGLGLVALSHRWRWVRRFADDTADGEPGNPAAPYLVPFVVLMTALMICAALSDGFDYLYPVKFFAVAAAILCFWQVYAQMGWTWSWPAAGLGVVVFLLWLGLEPFHGTSLEKSAIPERLDQMAPGLAMAWLVFRVLGSVVTVPIAEELAFRGFLIRWLQNRDFDTVALNTFSWLSFGVSSLLFGLLHDRLVAGTLAGMVFAWALYRRGQLSDAVLAHATANALIAGYVLSSGNWAMWS